jgi:iron complex transport system permease protein
MSAAPTTATASRRDFPVVVMGFVFLLAMLLALTVGQSTIAWWSGALFDGAQGFLFREIRLPRVLGAALLGGSLAVVGLASQVALRNPLASPDVLGVSAGAALGGSVALAFGGGLIVVSFAALAAGLAATAVVTTLSVTLSHNAQRDPVLVAILIGMALSSFCAAGLAAVKWLADPSGKLPAITYWLLGSLAAFGWRELVLLLFASAVSGALLWSIRQRIGVLALGDDVAQSVGASVSPLRWRALVACAIISAASVAVAGLIPWIALLVPHAARLVSGTVRPWALSGLLGATLLVVVDTLCRSVSEVELPPGVVLAFVGVPVFVWLIGRARGAKA